MDIIIYPNKLHGTIHAIPSKSQAHRMLICAAFSSSCTQIVSSDTNQDIEATVSCLNALGARITRTDSGYFVKPAQNIPKSAELDCNESGSTLRFLLPVVGALGVDATFLLRGRLPMRPLSPLWEEMVRMGCCLSWSSETTLHCCGKLSCGTYEIDGGVSSQFISGLLFAAALMDGETNIQITGKIESLPYIILTQQALSTFGVQSDGYRLSGKEKLTSPGTVIVEGDWSNGAFFLAANALGSCIDVKNLDTTSKQGDRVIADILDELLENTTISAQDIPDLIPILSVVAAVKSGARFTHIQRLRLKESDRVSTTIKMLKKLGTHAVATEDTLTVFPGVFYGGTVDAAGDHRIAMAAAIAATAAETPVTIIGAECVAKSYPSFWEEYRKLGGIYEQFLR